MRKNMYATSVVGALLYVVAGTAQTSAQGITLSGQLRPRAEFRSSSARSDALTTMRARLAAHATVAPGVAVLLELQDVRLWGDELTTTTNPDHIELHQGFIDLGDAAKSISARIGRQETSYGEERLIGASDWTQQARAFDGVRGRFGKNRLNADAFVYQIADAVDAASRVNDRFIGSYVTYAPAHASIEGYVLHNHVIGASLTSQTTAGARIAGSRGALAWRVESALQSGTRAGANVRAFLGAARATVTGLRGAGQITAWYDYLSGDDDPADGKARVFDTLYGTNHKFYGTADIFTNIPLHTGNRGLQDVALKTSYNVTKTVVANLDGHRFIAAAGNGMTSTDFGSEADLNATYRYTPRFTVTGGASYYHAGDGMTEIHRAIGNQVFTYMMVSATIQ